MASEITIAHNVQRHFNAGQFCGSETEIVISLPQKDYKRLTRSLGWRSVHWPARRRGRPRKLTTEPVENRSPRRRSRPRKLKAQPVENCSPRHHPAVDVVEVRVPLTPPPSPVTGCEDLFILRLLTPPPSPTPATPSRPSELPKRLSRPRVPERDRFVEPDVPYVLQTLREMLAVAQQKEAYHEAALRAVQGPRVMQRRRAFAILPLLRKECIRPIQKAILELEKKLDRQQ